MTRQVAGAALATRTPSHSFPYDTARSFQAEYLDWLHDQDDESVAVLQAPTGAGKTAAFTELLRDRDQSLVLYPTNALMEQQRDILESEADLDVFVLNADSLESHGLDRRDELLAHTNPFEDHDVILTNPDILQAIIQDQYVDYNAKLLRFFERFDGVIYDEFHAYDPFAASGLLLQLKLFRERRPDAKLTLASATPRDDYLSFIKSTLDVELTRIRGDIVDPSDPESDRFRHPMTVHRSSDRIWDDRDSVAETLRRLVNEADSLTSPQVALIFNSAYDSNRFHEFLASRYPRVYEHCEKDNGYETRSDVEVGDEFFILNTTSKGEVGLNYDIRHLHMDTPRTASQFIQRIGRAGRESSATVHVHDCGTLPWPDAMEYETFLSSVWDAFEEPQANADRLSALVALRAAHAVASRQSSDNTNEEMWADFASIDGFDHWLSLIRDVREAKGTDYSNLSFGQPQPTKQTLDVIDLLDCAIGVLSTLRGRTLSHRVRYPRGDATVTTEYDVLSAFRWYGVESVTDDVIALQPVTTENSVRVKYVGLPDSIEYSGARAEFYSALRVAVDARLDSAAGNVEEVLQRDPDELRALVESIGISYAVKPRTVITSDYEFEINDANTLQPR